MNLETKANPGDVVFYIRDNKVCSAPVRAIQIRIAEDGFSATRKGNNNYDPFDPNSIGIIYFTCHGRIRENEMYRSKEELAEAIVNGTFNDECQTGANDAPQLQQ